MADLLVDSGKHRGRKLKLGVGETLIGRDVGCAIRLATADVSRRHCRLSVAVSGGAEVVTVEDLGSRNGTFVNGQPVRGPRALKAGDSLRVGPAQFVLPHPDTATESEVVNWLVPPPAPGTVPDDEPTQVPGAPPPSGSEADDERIAAPVEPAGEPVDAVVRAAAAVLRRRRTAGVA